MSLYLFKKGDIEHFKHVFSIEYFASRNCLVIRHGKYGWGSHTCSNRCLDDVYNIVRN